METVDCNSLVNCHYGIFNNSNVRVSTFLGNLKFYPTEFLRVVL
ncbi:hypothetical protein LEP1GSC126_3992 [Leptospira kirschneri str. 200801774]|nr:hypothetical protein LEP1GSC126_3992 [Leptospira kirschneri str. 200801774]